MSLSTVTYSAKDGIGRVVLDRPAQLNAISPALLEERSDHRGHVIDAAAHVSDRFGRFFIVAGHLA